MPDAAGRYKEVELKVSGGWSYENLAPGAKELRRRSLSAQASKEEQEPAGRILTGEQDYAVYSALLNGHPDQVKLMVIRGITKAYGGTRLLPEDYSRFSVNVSKETFADFIARNERPLRLDRRFHLNAGYVLLSEDEIKSFSLNWQRFDEKYPGALHRVVSLSNIGYNEKRNEAMVLTGYICGPRCCGSSYVFLTKERDGWRIKGDRPAAIC